MMKYSMLGSVVLSLVMGVNAGITYDPAAGVLWVRDYPADWPCTPERLRAMDRLSGWGKVAYDPSNDTTTVDADLWIGHNLNTETYFQLGGPAHPRETLLVKGNVVVYPSFIDGQNPEQYWWTAPYCVNRLTLGVSNNPAVTASLKIDSGKGYEHSLYIGRFPQTNKPALSVHGGQLHVYYSTFTAARQDVAHAIGDPKSGMVFLCGDQQVLDHATFSWVADLMTYGNLLGSRDSVFEYGGTGLIPAKAAHAGAVFRNLRIAVLDYGSIDCELTDCVFTNNDSNWVLRFSDRGLTCIDCVIAPPRRGDGYQAWTNPQTKTRHYPSFISRRHIVVAVANETGAPVTNAVVTAVAGQPGTDLVDPARVQTDKSGKTPGPGQPKALLLTEVIKQATDVTNQPAVREFSYELKVSAPGYQSAAVPDIKPTVSWQVVSVVLKK